MTESEIILVNKLKQGNLKIFENLFKTTYEPLCRYALRFLKSQHESEEIVQELFSQIWENRKNLNINSSLNAYLYKSVYYNSMALIRKTNSHKKYQDYIINNKRQSIAPVNLAEEEEINQIIDISLNKLTKRNREIFELSRFKGLSYKEIALKLSISVKTVEANIGKALKLFRKNLKDYSSILVLFF